MFRRWATWAIFAGLIAWEWWLYASYAGADFWVAHGNDPGADAAGEVMRVIVWALAVGGAIVALALLAFSWWRSRRIMNRSSN